MALQKLITLDNGITIPEAYIRVTDAMLSYGQNRAWVTASIYASKEARLKGFQPVKVEEFRAFNTGGQELVNAQYKLNISNVVAGSGDSLSLDLDGDGESEVTLIEGVDFVAEMIPESFTTEVDEEGVIESREVPDTVSTVKNIVEALNQNEVFSAGFVAEANGRQVVITATGDLEGDIGNSLLGSGNVLQSYIRDVDGKSFSPTEFDKYFNIEDMSMTGVNVVSQVYELLKTLEQFKDAIDA